MRSNYSTLIGLLQRTARHHPQRVAFRFGLSGEEIRCRTFDELPRYALQSEIGVRRALPLTSSGELDRRAIQRARESDPDDHA